LHQPAWAAVFDIFGIIAVGFGLSFILQRTGVYTGILAALVVFVGYVAVCQVLFIQKGFVLNLVYPLAVWLSVYVIITAYKYLVESRQKRFIKNAFSTYWRLRWSNS
jgi:adenylate cyclase